MTGIAALRSKWAVGKARRRSISDRYVTEEQRGPRPIFIATLRATRILSGCFVAHRPNTTAGILPLRFAHPATIRSSAAIPVPELVQYCAASHTMVLSTGGRRIRWL